MGDANAVRGEVDLVLGGQSFVLRPSYTAVVAMEKKTGFSLLQLAQLAEQGVLTQEALASVVTELVRAWGREQILDEYASPSERSHVTSAKAASVESIADLLYPVGVMAVQPRIAIVLGLAATGGCLPSGEVKATGMTTPEIPVAV